MTPSSVLLAHLYALRAHVEALVLLAETETGVASVEPGSCPTCGASPDQVDDTSTLDGTKRSRCQQCESEWVRSKPDVNVGAWSQPGETVSES